MKQIKWLFVSMMCVVWCTALSGCGKDTAVDQRSTYTLSCDKTNVKTGETVTFTVRSDKQEDVTADWVMSDENDIYTGNTVSYDKAGKYVVSAHSKNDDSIVSQNSVTITVVEAPQDEITYSLLCPKPTVSVNEKITFMVVSSKGDDVTESWNMCDENFCYTSNTFSYPEPGVHTITAHSKDNPEIEAQNTIKVTVKASNKEPEVNPNATYVLRTNASKVYVYEQVSFTVKEVVDDVEKDSDLSFRLIVDGEMSREMSHIFSTTGTYNVCAAAYNTSGVEIVRTETLEITVGEREIIGQSDNFYRRSLFLKRSTTDCTTCPAMDYSLHQAMDLYIPNRLVPVTLHEKDDECGVSAWTPFETMLQDYNFYNVPNYVIDWNMAYTSGASYSTIGIANQTKAWQAKYAPEKTPGLAIESSLNGHELSMKLMLTTRVEGTYLLGLYILESGFETYQHGATGNRYEQNHVLFYSLTDGSDNNKLGDLGQLNANQEYVYDYKFTIPESTGSVHNHYHNLDNCTIVYFVCKKESNIRPHGYYCANVVSVPLGESAEYEYEPIYAED